MRSPSNNGITLEFGASGEAGYTQSAPHRGTDWGYAPDRTIYAPCDATIKQIPNNGADGNGTYFDDPSGRYYIGLLHASSYLVPNGSKVTEGQPIAIMGATGTATGVHVHMAVIDRYKAKDPILGQYINPLSIITTGGKGGGEQTNEGADMPTNPTIETMRIIQSEVCGSDENYIHSGQFDNQLKAAWSNTEVNSFVMAQWTASDSYRKAKQTYKDFYYAYQATIGELSARPTRAELDSALAKLVEEQAKVSAAESKLTSVLADNTSLKDQQTKEEEQGKSIFRIIAQLFSKSK